MSLFLRYSGVVATIVRVGYVNTLSKATDTYFSKWPCSPYTSTFTRLTT